MIDALRAWDVLLPDVADDSSKLNAIRNNSVHFRHDLDKDVRTPALEAIRLLEKIINQQFSALDNMRWFIPGTPGAAYLRRDVEDLPFIRLVFIPNSFLVSSQYRMHFTSDGLLVTDEVYNSARELNDEQFAAGEY